jgi:hypothetical protein
MEDIMDELIMKNKAKEAIAVAAQAKKEYPESPFIENIKNKENQIINPVLN